MDIGSVAGLILGFTMMAGALAFMGSHGEGSVNLASFVDVPAIMMVLGGGLAVALVGFPMKRVRSMFKVARVLFFRTSEDPKHVISDVARLAETARRDGLLALDQKAAEIADPFLAMGIQMAVDGTPAQVIEQIMRTEMELMEARHYEAKKVLETVGRCGPAFGMIATLLGLVMMLGNLSNAESIGPSMAVALVGTLYGAVIANLVCIPFAEKLACLHHEEMVLKEIVVRGVVAIQSGDNPRVVEQKLMTFLPPTDRTAAVQEAA